MSTALHHTTSFRLLVLAALIAVMATFAVSPAIAKTPHRTPAPPAATARHSTKAKAATARSTTSSKLQAADLKVLRKAPRGLTAFDQWLGVIEKQGAGRRAPKKTQVVADVKALDRIAPGAVRALKAMSHRRAQRLLVAITRSSLEPAMRQSGVAFTGEPGFYFHTTLQYWLEQLGTAAHSRGGLTLLPLVPRGRVPSLSEYQREIVVDTDQDGTADAFETDADGDGLADDRDPSDTRLGVPDEFLARAPYSAANVSTAPDDQSAPWTPCLFARESMPHLGSLAAASAFRTSRDCRQLGATDSAPGNTGQPVVTGTASVGSTLTATPGTWTGSPTFAYTWRYQDTGGGWPAINGATSSTYTLQDGDLGHLVRVDVTATNGSGSAAQASPEIGPIKAGGNNTPEVLSAPSVSGTVGVGSLLTADPGQWTGSPTYGYQWQRQSGGSWSAIAGATAQSYIPVTTDVGNPLRVEVTANNGSGQGTADSAATRSVPAPAPVPVNTAMPTVSGTAQVGQTLTATPGTWTGSPSLSYTWQRSTQTDVWSSIGGANGSTYTLVPADVGAVLRVQVTGTNNAGNSVAPSAQTSTVVASGGCLVSSTTDTDNDGVPDCQEIAGFTLTIATTGTGTTTNRKVTSDPTKPDTDGDGVPDGIETQGQVSDPSLADTDGDGLNDYAELLLYKSLPSNVDSDGDALVPGSNPRSADPRLLDGREVNGYAFAGQTISTSPTLSDTDGDSISDYTELNTGGYNPLVADMPKLQVNVPSNVSTDIQLFTTRTDTSEQVNYSGSLDQSSDTESTHTVDLTNVQTIDKTSDTLDEGVKAGYAKGLPYVEAHVNNSTTWEKGTVTDTQTGFTKDSTQTTQQQYQKYTQDTTSHTVTTAPAGTLSTAVTLHNPGKITYTAKNLVVTAFQQDPSTPGNIEPIATLQLPDAVQSGITLAPNDTKGPYEVSATDVSSDKLLGLLADPGSLIYTVADPSLTNTNTGVSYATVGQDVNAQTASVSIDDGTNNPVTYLVATNVLRDATGANAGVSMRAVMNNILHQPYGYCAQNDGRNVLCSIGSVKTTDQQHAWSVLASEDVGLGVDFDSLVLKAGSVIRLTYLVDSDGDGLLDPQENLYGTSLTTPDTDGDGLDDYAETRSGWTVPKIGGKASYQAYSNPLTDDIDGDGSHDACPNQASTCGTSEFGPESVRLTDPNAPDTNGDGIFDGQQDDSTVLAYCPGCYRVPSFAAAFGTPGDGDGEFGQYGPGALAVDKKGGFVYVSDIANSRVEQFDLNGKFLLAFGSNGVGGGGRFNDISGIAVDPSSNVFVTDDAGSSIQKFGPDGSFKAEFVDYNLEAVAVDSTGYVYAATMDHRIFKFDSNLKQLADIPTGNLGSPSGLAVDSTGAIYLSSVAGGGVSANVTKMDSTGNILATWFSRGGDAFGSPNGIALDRYDHLYVSDSTTNTVVKLDSDAVLASWGSTGSGSGLFDVVAGLGVDASCSVYVTDNQNYRVQKFSYPTGCN